MAASVQLKMTKPVHDSIIDWLLANPEKSYGECAAAFGYSQAWFSIIVNSDAFKALYAKRRQTYNAELSERLQTALTKTTVRALEKFSKQLDEEDIDPALVLDASDRLLARAGYGPTGKSPALLLQQNITIPVDRQVLAEARETIRGVGNGAAGALSAPTACGGD